MKDIGYGITLVAYCLFGFLASHFGMGFDTPRFWLFMFCMILNSAGCIL